MGIIDDFLGKSGLRDVEQAEGLARAERARAEGRADNFLEQGGVEARNALAPFLQGGQGAQEQLLNALGINGLEAQQEFANNFGQFDALFQGELDAGADLVDSRFAQSGGFDSGARAKALMNLGQQHKRSAFNNRLNRLSALGGQGFQAGNQTANLFRGVSGDRANLAFGAGQQNANALTSLGNARAGQRQQGIGNILGGIGAIGKIAGGLDFGGDFGGFGTGGVQNTRFS